MIKAAPIRLLFSTVLVISLLLNLSDLSTAQVLSSLPSSEQDTSYSSFIRVPQDIGNLQDAILLVKHHGVIELDAGTYPAPGGGFAINNLGKSFTIQAAKSGSAVLDGGGNRDIVRLINQNKGAGGMVIFKGLTFANGFSATFGIAGGVSIHRGEAVFRDCAFINNTGQQPSTGGGAVVLSLNSVATFDNCTWKGNTAVNSGGGLAVGDGSAATVVNSRFENNRTNLPNHLPTSAGGGIHVGNSTLSVANSHFENNQAGYAGGGIYAIGTWAEPLSTPRATVSVSHSTFVNNQAARDASVNFSAPTEGGAIHIEDQATLAVHNSRFDKNKANIGGGVNQYRAIVEINNSVFRGNQATGNIPGSSFGGAIAASSNDTSADGDNNRRSAYLAVKGSLILGSYDSVSIVAPAGGGIYASGDGSRIYGLGGVSKKGNLAENRAKVIVENVIFADTDVQEFSGSPGNGGAGGALLLDMADLTMRNSLIIFADAIGSTNSSGGGMAILNQSYADIGATTIARSTSGKYGAAIFLQGSEINLWDCNLVNSQVGAGSQDQETATYGAAIFSSPDTGRGLPVTGVLKNCVISSNTGLPIFDDDRTNGPINDLRYDGNQIYSNSHGDSVFRGSVAGWKTVSELNNLVVTRSNGTSTKKSQVANQSLSSPAVVGAVLAAPSYIVSGSNPSYFLGYAWSGGDAQLDGNSVSGNAGLTQKSSGGVHTLSVDRDEFKVNVAVLSPRLYLPVAVK